MDLFEELRADQDPRSGRCKVCGWIDSRPADERDAWVRAIRERESFTAASIYRAMRKRNADIGRTAVDRCRMEKHRG